MSLDNVVVLTGGTGTVKLLKGLNKIIPTKLAIITNTGDDFYYYGLKVCPDTDALIYALSGQLDESKMWGLKGDSFILRDILKTIDITDDPVANWFNLGDKDLAYCLYRTFLLHTKKTLSEVTELVKNRMGIIPSIFPMSDTDITTYFITTDDRKYHFEEFFIRLRSEKPIKEIFFQDVEKAVVSEKLLLQIYTAKLIILGPSNPITSIGPILAVAKIKRAIIESKAIKIVISPIIGRDAYSGPAKTYMQARNIEVSPLGIYTMYEELADHFFFDKTDEKEFKALLEQKASEKNKKIFFEDIIFNTEQKQNDFSTLLIKKYEIEKE